VVIPDNNPTGATSNITVSGIPASCNVSAVAVTMNISHTWVGDISVVLRAPNGSILNLDREISGTGGGGASTGFTNTKISSAGTNALSSAGNPYTGTFRADASMAANAGPAGYSPTVSTWPPLYSSPNGVWTLGLVDNFNLDEGTLTSWCLDISYVCGVPSTAATWSPVGGLFNDAAATIAYTGDARDTVWTRPAPSGVYNYQVTVQSVPTVLPVIFSNPASITINDGAATPYPSNLVVSGLATSGVAVGSVTLTGMNHTWASDIDILLQSPSGQNVVLMSDAGGNVPLPANAVYTFSDGSPAMTTAVNASGTYRPTNLVGTLGVEPDNWPAPGPGVIAQPNPTLSSFTGNMNGTWKLFVFDDASRRRGSTTREALTRGYR
jgi:subtilisin-like proprotein convertase family protein